jgi:hypothetical protein
VIPVEQRSRDAFQGVAKVDEEDTRVRAVALVAGDIAALMLFAAIGRGNHGEGVFLADVAATAAPFAAGWFLASPVAGTFGDAARGAKGRSRGGGGGEGVGARHPRRLGVPGHRQRRGPPEAFRDRQPGGDRRVLNRVARVVREKRGRGRGREQKREPARVHGSAHEPHQAVVTTNDKARGHAKSRAWEDRLESAFSRFERRHVLFHCVV